MPGQVEHGVEQDILHDRPQAARAGLAGDRRLAIAFSASSVKVSSRLPARTAADTA
jgi:hypothetical protein